MKPTAAQLHETFVGMLTTITRRPTLYTRNGTFWEVVAFIDGYTHGTGYPAGDTGMGSGMQQFGAWLAACAGQSDSRHWGGSLLDQCGGDEMTALEQLRPLYVEYAGRKGKGRRTPPDAH